MSEAVLTELSKQVSAVSHKPVKFDASAAQPIDFIRHDQGQLREKADTLVVELRNSNYQTVNSAHELLHYLFNHAQEQPHIHYPLSTKNKQMDTQLMAVAQELYDILAHTYVYARQRELGVLDDAAEQLFQKGIVTTLTPEKGQADGWLVLRCLNLFDVMIFYAGKIPEKFAEQLQHRYPTAFAAASQLYATLTDKGNGQVATNAFYFRRTFVALAKKLDEILAANNLATLHLAVFAQLTPVVSARQLRLQVKQTFQIMRAPFALATSKAGKQDAAYVGRTEFDEATAFVVAAPTGNTAAFFKQLYAQPLAQFFADHDIKYLERK